MGSPVGKFEGYKETGSRRASNGCMKLDPMNHGEPHQYTIIFLAGLGDDSAGFRDVFL